MLQRDYTRDSGNPYLGDDREHVEKYPVPQSGLGSMREDVPLTQNSCSNPEWRLLGMRVVQGPKVWGLGFTARLPPSQY